MSRKRVLRKTLPVTEIQCTYKGSLKEYDSNG